MDSFKEKTHLVILWATGDPEVAEKTIFMYARNAKINEYWPKITLVVWGPSVRLLADDVEMQMFLEDLTQAKVIIQTDKSCADGYGVGEKLEELGVEVKDMGITMTGYLKDRTTRVVTF